MPAANSLYIFKGQTIGSNGVLADAINIPEMMYSLTKKGLGIPNTTPDALYTFEPYPNYYANTPNAFPFIHQVKMYSQTVPLVNPMVNTYGIFTPSNTTQDTSFVNSNYIFFSVPMSNDMNSSRWLSKDYPYICYYSNVLLTNFTTNQYTFNNTLYSNYPTTFGHPLLVNSISGRYDVSYLPTLFANNGINYYSESDGYWQLDNDTGIVMFFDSNTTQAQVTARNAPRMSFYRYEGLFGEANITQGQYL